MRRRNKRRKKGEVRWSLTRLGSRLDGDRTLEDCPFVLGYEKLHRALLQGACLGLRVNHTNLTFPSSSSSFLARALTNLQLTLNVLARVDVKCSTDIHSTTMLVFNIFIVTFHFVSVHTLFKRIRRWFRMGRHLEWFHPKRASTLSCLKQRKRDILDCMENGLCCSIKCFFTSPYVYLFLWNFLIR